MEHREQENISAKDIWGVMSRPMKWIISAFGGVSFFTIVSIVVVIRRIYDILVVKQGELNAKLIILLVSLISFFLLILIAFSIVLSISLIKIKFDNKFFNQNVMQFAQSCELFSSSVVNIEPLLNETQNSSEKMSNVTDEALQVVNKMNSIVSQIHLSKFILDERQITKLEESVGGGYKIVVMTSQYKLDSGKLLQIILNNIRKGVIYEYLIPNEKGTRSFGEKHEDFCKVVCEWWKQFLRDYEKHTRTFDQNEYSLFGRDYIQLVENRLDSECEELKDFFLEHVKEHIIANEYSLITVIMYQKGNLTAHEWEAIIKLPTVSNDNYYAFKVPDEETKEKRNLIEAIERLCRNTKEIKLSIQKHKGKWIVGGNENA